MIKEADILDIFLGKLKEAISRKIIDDFFVRFDHKTNKVIGFSTLNSEKWFEKSADHRLVPMTARFSLV